MRRSSLRLNPPMLHGAIARNTANKRAQVGDSKNAGAKVRTRTRKRGAGVVPTEHAEQVAFVKWFRAKFPRVLIFAIPNGGSRHIATARKLKAEGVLPGVADLFVPKWNLWIEMKRAKGGTLSDSQSFFRDYVTLICRHNWLRANGCDHGIDLLLSMKRDYAQWWTE